jgi:hypothetical protein
MVARAVLAGMELTTAYQAVADQYVKVIDHKLMRVQPRLLEKVISQPSRAVARLRVAESDKILIHGPFANILIDKFIKQIPTWVKRIVDQLQEVRDEIGIIKVDGEDIWLTTLSTQGIYADLALGICSGAEDFYEIQRQFDLELKKLEIEKLKAELEKLKLEKQLIEQGKSLSSVTITNPPDQTEVNLGVSVGKTPAEVEFKKTE